MSRVRYTDVQARIIANSVLSQDTSYDGTPCWIWIGALNSSGYPLISVRRDKPWPSKLLGHRASYEAFVGPIPEGLVLLHLCDVKRCVAPLHLRSGTQAENIQDSIAKGRHISVSRKVAV